MPAMGHGDDSEVEGEELPKLSHEVKLKELLRNLNSAEIKLCSNASKDFIKLLRGRAGGELLRLYVQNSSKLTELDQAWNLQLGKLGLSYVLKVISAILSHPDGVYNSNDTGGVGISRALDKFAHSIIEEKLGELYKELNSKEAKRQNAALLLLASVVRRGSGLASDVAKSFDFKLPIFPKLVEYKAKRIGTTRKHSTRQAFVGLAMSFRIAEMGPTVEGDLVNISGREDGGVAAELAHGVLVIACTDPSNGLMPDLNRQPNPLKGNLKRLLDLMKKLKATDVDYHRDLLLAIVKGRPLFGSAFMDEFPYNVEDNASPNWFFAVSLAANLVLSVGSGMSFDFKPEDPPSFSNPDVQSLIKCICPRPFTRAIVNKGLLHTNSLMKHGILRLVLEELKLLDSLITTIESNYCSSDHMRCKWLSLKQDIQNEVRILLPDTQVLLSLLSSLSTHSKSLESSLKRTADSEISLEQAMGHGDDSEVEGEELPKLSHEVKLKELLRNLNSAEIKLCSNASKDFIKLLRGRAGGELLRLYVQNSSKLTELDQAWNLQLGKPGLSYVLKVISAILSHPDGVYNSNDTGGVGISRALDKFAHSIIEEKLGDLYKELNSKEAKRQNAALLLLASVVRRGSGLASDVAKSFDFKLPIFPKLAEYKAKRIGTTRKHSTRQAFVGLAMSFRIAEMGPTVEGDLVNISGREDGGVAAELAHGVLVIACTDHSNGLMPDLNRQPNPLKGNLKRLLDLMKKLKATDVDYHRDLLLAIVKGRPLFGSAFMDEFPYNVEDNASPNWFFAVSLAVNLVLSVGSGLSFDFKPEDPPSFSNPDVQSLIKCICPRPFTRAIVNKGLLHTNSLMKHGILRLVLEELKLLDSLITTIESSVVFTFFSEYPFQESGVKP
ncbi:hypothetical protein RHGRI_021034 [Rhododendron griersonianum]|uniref:URB1 N-terminal domain-containing protein n=1 Tax=Rhododendron griersonianum TaxID=479676 RepID=A0AAV6JPS1_9ERIC|nr:hypothetical protein RHGRI_021034 [Rhododendron griersonianum]